jgi:hypothetical protein
MYEQRNFAIFSVSELNKINFGEVLETDETTVRKNVIGDKTFVKWDGEQPEFVETLETLEGPYTYSEMLEILSGEEWVSVLEDME